MKIRFRRRTIRDIAPDGSGMVTEWKIPLDPEATDDEDALFRHFRRMSRINPDTVVALMGTRFGSLILGSVRVTGIPTGRGSLGRWENRVEAKSGRLTPEEYEEKMFKNTPLARRVYRRLNSEPDPWAQAPSKKVARRLKGFQLALRWSRMTPEQINEWLSSDKHQAELDALLPPDPAAVDGERPKWRKRGEPRN